MSIWELWPDSSCLVALSSSSYNEWIYEGCCLCWHSEKNHRFSYIACSSVLDLVRTWRCKSVLHMVRTWRSWSCMSIAFSRLFLLSRLMSTWRPCTSLRFCVRISNSLLKVEKNISNLYFLLIEKKWFTWSCLSWLRRALCGMRGLSEPGWTCNKQENCCCDYILS